MIQRNLYCNFYLIKVMGTIMIHTHSCLLSQTKKTHIHASPSHNDLYSLQRQPFSFASHSGTIGGNYYYFFLSQQ